MHRAFLSLQGLVCSILCKWMLACEYDSEAFGCRGDISPQKKQKRFYQEDQAKQARYRTEVDGLKSQTRATKPQEPCGRRVKEFCYSHASSPSTYPTDIRCTFSSLSRELFLRGEPCYEPQLPWLQQAVQPQCQALCGHPTSLGSAHTGLTDCP